MIKEAIQDINNLAINSGLVERYGKYCTLRTDKKYPYGYGLEDDCFGNTYSFDERFKNVAFLELFTFNFEPINSRIQWLNIELRLHHFLNQKHQDIEKYYGVHLQLYYLIREAVGKLKKWMNTSFNMSPSFVRIDNCEYTVMTLNLRRMVSCDYVPDLDPDGCIEPVINEIDLQPSIPYPLSTYLTGKSIGIIRIDIQGQGTTQNIPITFVVSSMQNFSINIPNTMGPYIPIFPPQPPINLNNDDFLIQPVNGALSYVLYTTKKYNAGDHIYIGFEIEPINNDVIETLTVSIVPGSGGDINPSNNSVSKAFANA